LLFIFFLSFFHKMTLRIQWILLAWLAVWFPGCYSSGDWTYCDRAFWIRRDDHGDVYVYAHTLDNGLLIPPQFYPPPEEVLTHARFFELLGKVTQYNFEKTLDQHTSIRHEVAEPFVYPEFLEFLRIKKFECGSPWTQTEESQVTRMVLSHFYAEVEGMKGLTNWVNPLTSFCTWKGIHCDSQWKFQELKLTHLSLKGTLPTELGLIPSLPVLNLSGNQLHGTIPAALLSNIQHLDLSGNQFTSIAWEKSQINIHGSKEPAIEYLDVSVNHLSGSLPTRWNSQLANLRILDVSRNAFNGSITSLANGDLPSLEMLFLGANLFTGTLPTFTGSSLRLLDVGLNLLTGTIPAPLPTSLEAVILADNDLEGEKTLDLFLPLSGLEVLQLQNNHLRGSIPATAPWSELGTLSLRNNKFTGPLPPRFLQTVQHTMQQ
jgi:hypothetical protein